MTYHDALSHAYLPHLKRPNNWFSRNLRSPSFIAHPMNRFRPQSPLRLRRSSLCHYRRQTHTSSRLNTLAMSVPKSASRGDLNNTSAARPLQEIKAHLSYFGRSLAIKENEDDAKIRKRYRPFILEADTTSSDWVAKLELSTAMKMAEQDFEKRGRD